MSTPYRVIRFFCPWSNFNASHCILHNHKILFGDTRIILFNFILVWSTLLLFNGLQGHKEMFCWKTLRVIAENKMRSISGTHFIMGNKRCTIAMGCRLAKTIFFFCLKWDTFVFMFDSIFSVLIRAN